MTYAQKWVLGLRKAVGFRALEFDPERWMEGGDAVAPRDNDSYWPFGGGPRNCIGMGFAMMESILVSNISRGCYDLTAVIVLHDGG